MKQHSFIIYRNHDQSSTKNTDYKEQESPI